jgi:cellulose synthase/poly-beta-1,6-N-acetylglucosamine synthase-like glycosyltransferase
MATVFWFCVFATLYPYVVFPATLWICTTLAGAANRRREPVDALEIIEPFTIIVLAHNEEAHIERKIRESIPVIEIHPQSVLLIVSDHSSDRTVAVASAIAHSQVKVVESTFGRGRALASNFAVGLSQHEFLLFTDVETRVPPETARTMFSILRSERVGCVNAEIIYRHELHDNISEAAGFYWHFEGLLRSAETRMGLYATASGPCMAFRRSLFRELPPTGDVDFTTPLDVIDQGYRCMHLPGCVAYDVMPANAAAEFNVRARMVAKNFSGIVSRWGFRNNFEHPLYTWALYSHKILRWLVLFFLLGALLSNVALLKRHWIYDVNFVLQVAFYLMAVMGWIGYRKKKAWPFVQTAYAFVLAHLAFAVGILKIVTGSVQSYYIPTSQLRT